VVALEEDYPYSSASAHVLNTPDEILNEQLFDDKSRSDYIAFLREQPAEKKISTIRKSTKIGRPLGDNDFINKIGKLLGRQFLKTAPAKRVK
jgi:hypothetical protein